MNEKQFTILKTEIQSEQKKLCQQYQMLEVKIGWKLYLPEL